MSTDLRIVFVVMLIVTGILFALSQGNTPITFRGIWQMILNFLLIPAALITVGLFFMIIFRINPEEVALQAISAVSNRTVSFVTAIPSEMEQALAAKIVRREDTDGDGFEEWIVFYEYDLQTLNPVQISIYDNDRGVPPIIFPYNLRNPNNEFMGQTASGTNFWLQNVTQDNNGPTVETPDLQELVVSGGGAMSIFRFNKANKEAISPSQMPSEYPPRYESIGYFWGELGVDIGETSPTKPVTVRTRDREVYNRSQLMVRYQYTLNPQTNYASYYQSNCDPARPETCMLTEPVLKTVDFFATPPEDIYASQYPEKIVLAFYASTCAQPDGSLCNWANQPWDTNRFLHPEGDAQGGQASYFGLTSLDSSRNLQVERIDYFPTQGPAQTGGQAVEAQDVQITFTVDDSPVPQIIRLETRRDSSGAWKIFRRVPEDLTISDANVIN